MWWNALYFFAACCLSPFLTTATPLLEACIDASSPALRDKPLAPDPYIINHYPLEVDQVKMQHYGAAMTFESVATAAIDGMMIAYIYLDIVDKTAHQKVQMPQQEYKRRERSYEISLGSDLYAEDSFTVDDLNLIMRTIFQWGRTFQPREFEFVWMRRGKFHVMGSLKNGGRVLGEGANGTTSFS
ncbi:MAG: hypothetical protein HETSPECPRED_006674 [Heterodermia speciosa]|uniref:Uncharacterized protein n=1 Tax=Heterodermia speciosa TaxID=116794 RepID=A0A8H3IQI9_9LECA|nr:MAG: hypothetical protein HETSPECPRED_006674 [Heterodermia speciosa]